MSRRICIELYRELARLRPDWHQEEDGKGQIKVVMTGLASDPPAWQRQGVLRTFALTSKYKRAMVRELTQWEGTP